jgi:hypothetical protein
MFAPFSMALDDGTDTSDTAQWLIFIRGVNGKFGVITELLSLEAIKDCQELLNDISYHGTSWSVWPKMDHQIHQVKA